ncbi:MAG: hypothetical protein SGI98_06495 [Verrucomicrobiota bacterium]|nr:hypothetical protein [Verrucomicrobiota bacterium]
MSNEIYRRKILITNPIKLMMNIKNLVTLDLPEVTAYKTMRLA